MKRRRREKGEEGEEEEEEEEEQRYGTLWNLYGTMVLYGIMCILDFDRDFYVFQT